MTTPEEDMDITLETDPDAEKEFLARLRSNLPFRELARLMAAGIDPEEAYELVLETLTQDQEPDAVLDEDRSRALDEIDLQPTEAMASNAQRGLDLRKEFNRGGTAVGVARARDLANRTRLSPDTVGRMVSYFARHEVDKQGEGFTAKQDGYPSAGLIAWLLWGGDSGKAWADSKWAAIKRARDD